jgi:hypothetical protein
VGQIEAADTAIAWTLAQLPFISETMVVALSWPKNVEPQDLYPVAASTYTLPTGTTVEVPCFALNKIVKVEQAECPDSFVNPLDPDHGPPCVKVLHGPAFVDPLRVFSFLCHESHTQPCPVAAYTDNEYTLMWAVTNTLGLIGLGLNMFMGITWSNHAVFLLATDLQVPSFLIAHCYVCLFGVICRYIGGKKAYEAVPYQVKACVFAALLYNIVETLPSLVLKYNLPCSECKTEEW